MKKCILLLLLSFHFPGFSQTIPDSTKRLKEVVIHPYFSTQSLFRATGTLGLADSSILGKQSGTSLVSAMNSISGVRMEERSPGSYRLSLRGSLLRSPFGIRNVKIYLDQFPLTDAGGNSYLNALDNSALDEVQVLKGPQSSIYGANSGGVILIHPKQADQGANFDLNLSGGSFGLFRENLSFGKQWKNYELSIIQAYQRSDGYREHSGMERKYFQVFQKLKYTPLSSLKFLVLYSDLHYDTPGGLTAVQYQFNPQLSRPADGVLKSAVDQQAGIYSKTIYGGLSNEWQINPDLKHVVSVFTTYTDFKNPFITNYEHRKEFTYGLRTYLEYNKQLKDLKYTWNAGLESMQTATDYNNSSNLFGQPSVLQAADRLKAVSNFGFINFNMDLWQKWLIEISGSANFYKYNYESISPVPIPKKSKDFDVQFMPRVALSYLVNPQFSVRGTLSKGYSPPTLSEVRASNNIINVDLQPELGWNYETGFRYEARNKRFFADVAGFYYQLNNAIVRRLNQNDTEYFVNAGGTSQWGLETTLSGWVIPEQRNGLIRSLQFKGAYTLSKFKFRNYQDKKTDYSGNNLTGVPKQVLVTSADLQFPYALSLFILHNFTSKIPLNDANTVYADHYHLLQAKVSWKGLKIKKTRMELFAGADNLLNQKYSLGNDLNAANGRYFNASAPRNFYAGLAARFK